MASLHTVMGNGSFERFVSMEKRVGAQIWRLFLVWNGMEWKALAFGTKLWCDLVWESS